MDFETLNANLLSMTKHNIGLGGKGWMVSPIAPEQIYEFWSFHFFGWHVEIGRLIHILPCAQSRWGGKSGSQPETVTASSA